MKRMTTGMLAALATLLVVGCGSAEVSTQRMTDTQSALRAAERVGAQSDPQASLYLTYAKEQLERAEQLIEEDEAERAELMLERAEVDAELAMAKAQEAEVQREVEATLERIEALRTQASL